MVAMSTKLSCTRDFCAGVISSSVLDKDKGRGIPALTNQCDVREKRANGGAGPFLAKSGTDGANLLAHRLGPLAYHCDGAGTTPFATALTRAVFHGSRLPAVE